MLLLRKPSTRDHAHRCCACEMTVQSSAPAVALARLIESRRDVSGEKEAVRACLELYD